MKTLFATKLQLVIAIAFTAVFMRTANADVIMDWNARGDAIAAEKQVLLQTRVMSMLHIAMFEAVNAIERRYAPYRLTLSADRSTSKEAAAAAAAHDVLVSTYPDQEAALDAALAASLSGIPETEEKAKGIALGKEAAAGVIALRANDGASAQESYRPYTKAGAYVPTIIPLFSTFGASTPWVMTSDSQFRPGPPPALDSETWTRDVNEIRELGARHSTVRTAEQTTIGRFWFLVGPRTFNPILRQAAMARKMDVVDCARLFALASIAGNDALVAVFDAKYQYNFWRPITAIRNADITQNPATPRDESWMPLGDTPMHPEYPCAHCIVSMAVATVIEATLGSVDIPEVAITTPSAPGVTHRFTNLKAYTDEVANARIYAGFHYRYSTVVGQNRGSEIGAYVMKTTLQPLD